MAPRYLPILKWRQREVSALSKLLPSDRDNVMPVFELPMEPWNFDCGRPQLVGLTPYRDFGCRLSDAWGAKRCAIDAPHVGGYEASLQSLVLDSIFHQARTYGCVAVPVVGTDRSPAYLRAIRRICSKDGQGLCIRLHHEDIDQHTASQIASLLSTLQVHPGQCDVLIDFEACVSSSPNSHSHATCAALEWLPCLNSWRSLTVAATAMPVALPVDMFCPQGDIIRDEWAGFLIAAEEMWRRGIVLSFADYGVHHPRSDMVDPRLIGRHLTLIYASESHWTIYASPYEEVLAIREVARRCLSRLKRSTYTNHRDDGSATATPCWADTQIARLCDSEIDHQALRLWSQIATNRHVSLVSRQLHDHANHLYGQTALLAGYGRLH